MPPKTRSGKPPSRWSMASPRAQRRMLIASAAVFLAGVIAIAIAYMPGTSNAFKGKASTVPATLVHKEKRVKLDASAKEVARAFIQTAVMRQNIDASYDMVHPDLRGRLSRKQWDTGNIPVITYPAANAKTAHFVVDYSYQTEALLEVDLVARAHSNVRPELLFFLGLKREHNKPNGRWLVSYWEPHWRPPIPTQ